MNRLKRELTQKGILFRGKEDDMYSASSYVQYVGQSYIAVRVVYTYVDGDGVIIYDKNLNVVDSIVGHRFSNYSLDYQPTRVEVSCALNSIGEEETVWENYTLDLSKGAVIRKDNIEKVLYDSNTDRYCLVMKDRERILLSDEDANGIDTTGWKDMLQDDSWGALNWVTCLGNVKKMRNYN